MTVLPSARSRTVRVPAIGQRVHHRDGQEGDVIRVSIESYRVVVMVETDHAHHRFYGEPDHFVSIGPEPHRWITIELPEEPEPDGSRDRADIVVEAGS